MDIKVDIASVLSFLVIGLVGVVMYLLRSKFGEINTAILDLYDKNEEMVNRVATLEGVNQGTNHGLHANHDFIKPKL